jgi:hypothetical protein
MTTLNAAQITCTIELDVSVVGRGGVYI